MSTCAPSALSDCTRVSIPTYVPLPWKHIHGRGGDEADAHRGESGSQLSVQILPILC